MRTTEATGEHGRRREPDPARLAAVIARERGVVARTTIPSPPGVHRAVVEGGELVRPMVLWVGVREGESRILVPPEPGSEHLPEVRELPTRLVRGGRVWAALVEYLPSGSLRTLLASRAVSAGEAVTILLAVCDVLRRLHEAAFGGVSLGTGDIRFRADGCPVLMGTGVVGPLTEERARADSEGFLALADELGASVGGTAGDALVASARGAVEGDAGGVRDALLRVALPVAVRAPARVQELTGPADDLLVAEREVPLRSAGGWRAVWQRVTRRPASSVAEVGAGVAGRWWEAILEGDPAAVARATARRLLRERPKLVFAIAVPVVLGILALALLPRADVDGAHRGSATLAVRSTPSDAPTVRPESGTAAGATPTGKRDATDVAEPSGTPPPGEPDASDGAASSRDAAGSGDPAALDDPAAAAVALLEERRDGAVYAGAQVEVTQRWGDAVLVRVQPATGRGAGADSEPASLLMVRSEAGWRIRAVYS